MSECSYINMTFNFRLNDEPTHVVYMVIDASVLCTEEVGEQELCYVCDRIVTVIDCHFPLPSLGCSVVAGE